MSSTSEGSPSPPLLKAAVRAITPRIAAMWTPRDTRIRTDRNTYVSRPRSQRFPFRPDVHTAAYQPPPPPPPLKRPPPEKKAAVPAEALTEQAANLRREAAELEKSGVRAPPLRVQLGQLLLSKGESFIPKILKEWDSKGKGEFQKAEFRLNLRSIGINVSSAEADELFDSWDDDKGGSLDLKELKRALLGTQEKATAWLSAPDPTRAQVELLRQRAELADEAAELTMAAEALEAELAELIESNASRADVRLGELLAKRRIKPGAVVTQWSTSRGEHAGELSKAEFRAAVQGLGITTTGPHATSLAEIDAVFDTFDEDKGGFMDAEEAAQMIKSLQATADAAAHARFAKEREAMAARAKSNKKSTIATAMRDSEEEAGAGALVDGEERAGRTGVGDSAAASGDGKRKRKKKIEPPAELDETVSPVVVVEDGKAAAAAAAAGDSAASSPLNGGARPLTVTSLVIDSAMRLLNEIFSSERDAKGANDQTTELMVVGKKVVDRLQRLSVVRAWNTWKELADRRAAARATMTHALMRLRNPELGTAYLTWTAYATERARALRLMRMALLHLTHKDQIYAISAWLLYMAERKQQRRLMRKGHQALMRGAGSELAAGFKFWRADYHARGALGDDSPIAACLRKCLSGA